MKAVILSSFTHMFFRLLEATAPRAALPGLLGGSLGLLHRRARRDHVGTGDSGPTVCRGKTMVRRSSSGGRGAARPTASGGGRRAAGGVRK